MQHSAEGLECLCHLEFTQQVREEDRIYILFAHSAGDVEQREAGKLANYRKKRNQDKRKLLFQVCAQGL